MQAESFMSKLKLKGNKLKKLVTQNAHKPLYDESELRPEVTTKKNKSELNDAKKATRFGKGKQPLLFEE